MKTRKAFLATAAAGAAFAAPASVFGASSSPLPSPSPTPPPSPSALDFARRMRAFDSALTDAQIDDIAAGVDQAWGLGKDLRKSHPLKNGDAPTPQFEVKP